MNDKFKSFAAKAAAWGYVLVDYANQVIQANGGLLPTNKAGWLHLGGSILLAGGIHHASNTAGDSK
jgi:hypothetical protein